MLEKLDTLQEPTSDFVAASSTPLEESKQLYPQLSHELELLDRSDMMRISPWVDEQVCAYVGISTTEML